MENKNTKVEIKNTTLNDIKVWWACSKTQAEELVKVNAKEQDENKKKINERHIQLLKGMCVAFAMILENEGELDGKQN